MNLQDTFKHNKMNLFYELVILSFFIICGILGRIILVGWKIQPFPNFEILMVLTFLAALIIRPTFAFLVPLFSIMLSDLFLGNPIFIGSQMNKIVLFTYSGFLLISLISSTTRSRTKSKFEQIRLKNIAFCLGIGIGFVLLYDFWTNFGWWYLMYPHTIETLFTVYAAGIPFMLYHMLSAALTFVVIAIPIMTIISKRKFIQLQPITTIKEKITLLAITLAIIAFSII